jgi:hypothetical protein
VFRTLLDRQSTVTLSLASGSMRASLALLGALGASLVRFVYGYDNGLARTPQSVHSFRIRRRPSLIGLCRMGWNTWNHFGCSISEDTILSAAKAFVQYNLTSYGYECEHFSVEGCRQLLTLVPRYHHGRL